MDDRDETVEKYKQFHKKTKDLKKQIRDLGLEVVSSSESDDFDPDLYSTPSWHIMGLEVVSSSESDDFDPYLYSTPSWHTEGLTPVFMPKEGTELSSLHGASSISRQHDQKVCECSTIQERIDLVDSIGAELTDIVSHQRNEFHSTGTRELETNLPVDILPETLMTTYIDPKKTHGKTQTEDPRSGYETGSGYGTKNVSGTGSEYDDISTNKYYQESKKVIWKSDLEQQKPLVSKTRIHATGGDATGDSEQKSETVRLWQKDVSSGITSVTLLEHDGLTLVVYTMLMSDIQAMTISGEPATSRLPADISSIRSAWCISVSRDQTWAACISPPSRCTLLRREAGSWLRHNTFPVSVGYFGTSAAVTHDGDVVLVGKDDLMKYDTSGRQLWAVKISGRVPAGSTIYVSPDGTIYVALYYTNTISSYTPVGVHTQSISISRPLGVHGTGDQLVVLHQEGGDHFISMISPDGQHQTRLVVDVGGPRSICVHHNHMAVGIDDKLILYNITL